MLIQYLGTNLVTFESKYDNLVAVNLLEFRWEQHETFIKFELWWKNHEWNGALVYFFFFPTIEQPNLLSVDWTIHQSKSASV